MADKSGISWLAGPDGRPGATWQILAGCQSISRGCENCYSCRLLATRHRHLPWAKGLAEMTPSGPRWTGKVVLRRDQLDWPLKHRQPTRIFVADRGDLFFDKVPDGYVMDAWRIMGQCQQHTFFVLTKRPDRMASWMAKWTDRRLDTPEDRAHQLVRGPWETRKAHPEGRGQLFADMLELWGEPPDGCAYPTYDWSEGMRWWSDVLYNVCLGASACVAAEKYKIDQLRQIPAALRFLSLEPLLEDLGELDLTGIGWVIAGGESGPKARPLHPQWVRNVRDQCVSAGVPFFFKQWGTWRPIDEPWKQDSPAKLQRKGEQWLNLAGGQGFHGEQVWRLRKMGVKRADHDLDGAVWRQFPWSV